MNQQRKLNMAQAHLRYFKIRNWFSTLKSMAAFVQKLTCPRSGWMNGFVISWRATITWAVWPQISNVLAHLTAQHQPLLVPPKIRNFWVNPYLPPDPLLQMLSTPEGVKTWYTFYMLFLFPHPYNIWHIFKNVKLYLKKKASSNTPWISVFLERKNNISAIKSPRLGTVCNKVWLRTRICFHSANPADKQLPWVVQGCQQCCHHTQQKPPWDLQSQMISSRHGKICLSLTFLFL